MQTTIYTAAEEMELMSQLWTPALANDPFKFVMTVYPWGEAGTPLEHFKGPRRWQRNALRELRDAIAKNLHKTPDEQNVIIYDTFRKAIASGRGIGKSAFVSWLVHWMQTTRIGSTVIVSANSENQLRQVTWAEITKWFSMALNSHWFEINATTVRPAQWLKDVVERDLRKGTRYWAVEGKLWVEENPDAYAGVHNMDGVMLIFDEASGIPDSIWGVSAGFFTENTPNRFWFAFSNPRRNRGAFFECFNAKRDFWSTDNVDARTVEGTDKAVYDQIIKENGPDSYDALVEVYGMFPEQGDDQFISPVVVRNALVRALHHDPYAPIVIGVDPARTGTDSTVIVVRQGRDIVDIIRARRPDLMDTVDDVIEQIQKHQPDLVVIDEGGVGAGVVDALKRFNYQCRGVNFAWSPKDGRMYLNKRAEMWGDMRTWLQTASLEGLQPHEAKRLLQDLIGPMVKYDNAGVISLETKKEMRARGVASPDAADALAVTFAFPVGQRKLARDRVDAHDLPLYPYGNGGSNAWMGS